MNLDSRLLPTCAAREKAAMRDPLDGLPLRQMAIAAGEQAIPFARQDLLDALGRPGRYQIVRHQAGGEILAASECALAQAQGVLRRAYGPSIAFGLPMVRTYADPETGALMEPVTFLRVDAERSHAQDLRRLLQARCAQFREVDQQRRRVVLRAELALSRSLGLRGEIDELTGGAANVLAWLLGYRPALDHSRRMHACS